MKNVFSNVLEAIGNTPLIRINRMNPNPKVTLFVKWEAKNPGGSVKDRPALALIEAAERDGLLTPDKIIIEATSGNTGIGLAMVAAVKGYRIVLAMPETASLERQKILKAFGAELLLTPGSKGTDGAIEEVYNLVRENPDLYFMPDQFNNPANPAAHQQHTGPEIYAQTEGKVSVVVVTLGTTGTAMGILQAMKERDPGIQVVGVEPYPGHKVQGLKNMKESYVPGLFDRHALDAVVNVKDEEAFEMARRLAKEEGIFAGMSSGAAMAAAVRIAGEREDGIVVTILPDGGDRYLSTNLFTTLLEPDFRFYTLLQREKVEFKPVQEGKVRIFVTGPPLDKLLSLQELRRFLLADLLTRFLRSKSFSVNQVVLVPDLDSRAIQGSIAANRDHAAYTQQQLEHFLSDLDQIGIQKTYSCPRTTEHVDTIIEFTRSLINKGLAYEKLRSVYFDLSKSSNYGVLSRVDPKKVRLGKTVDLDAYEKLNPRDFTLLKRSTLAELKRGVYLKTDWGNVLPTWHIAAASVAIHDLGAPIDIHVSSVDFLFPHLENLREIGEALTGKPFANIWMLCERIWSSQQEKQESHLDENLSIREFIAAGYSAMEIRYWLLNTHYRKPIHISSENILNARRGYDRLKEFISRVQYAQSEDRENRLLPEMSYALEQSFVDALADDLNMPLALAALFRFVRQANPILDQGDFNEAQRKQIVDVLKKLNALVGVFDMELQPLNAEERALIDRREKARSAKMWVESDRLRQELLERGLRVFDTTTGTRWERIGEASVAKLNGIGG
jgi:cysteinyl-tRNA synthetase